MLYSILLCTQSTWCCTQDVQWHIGWCASPYKLLQCHLAVPLQSTCGRPSRWTPWSTWRPLRWWRLGWRRGSASARPVSWWSPASMSPPGDGIRSDGERRPNREPWRESELNSSEKWNMIKWGYRGGNLMFYPEHLATYHWIFLDDTFKICNTLHSQLPHYLWALWTNQVLQIGVLHNNILPVFTRRSVVRATDRATVLLLQTPTKGSYLLQCNL